MGSVCGPVEGVSQGYAFRQALPSPEGGQRQVALKTAKGTELLWQEGKDILKPGTGEFPAQMASNAEKVSILWRHHVQLMADSEEMIQNNHHWNMIENYTFEIEAIRIKGQWVKLFQLNIWLGKNEPIITCCLRKMQVVE